MAFDFPNSPTEDQTFTPPGGPTYTYNAPRWLIKTQGGGSGASITIADTAPASPVHGAMWWESDSGALYIFYLDPGGAPGQWVMVSGPGASQQTDYVRKTGDTMTGTLNGTSVSMSGTISATGNITSGGGFQATGNAYGGNGSLLLRPNGVASATGQAILDAAGTLSITGTVISGAGSLQCSGPNALIGPVSPGSVFLRPNGVASGTGQVQIDANGSIVTPAGLYGTNIVLSTGGAAVNVTGYSGSNPIVSYLVQANPAWANMYFQSVHVPGSWAGFQWDVNGSIFVFRNAGIAAKPGGGSWVDSSDARIKTVMGDYAPGLEEIVQLRPVTYTFKGNDTDGPPDDSQPGPPPETPQEPQQKPAPTVPYRNSPHYNSAIAGTEYVGFVAQEIETIMPGMVTQRTGYIDGEEVSDLRDLDTNELIFALVNAVRQLAAKVEALEAANGV